MAGFGEVTALFDGEMIGLDVDDIVEIRVSIGVASSAAGGRPGAGNDHPMCTGDDLQRLDV